MSSHRLGNFFEAGNVRAHNQIVRLAEFDSVGLRVAVNVRHDSFKPLVDFFKRPAEAFGILAHLKRTDGNTTGVGSFGGAEENFIGLEVFNGVECRGHVGTFADDFATVGNESFCRVKVDLLLRGAGQSDIALDVPNAVTAFVVFACGVIGRVFGNASALNLFDEFDSL